jgi:phage/plasmid primase-like uncharacterized protein
LAGLGVRHEKIANRFPDARSRAERSAGKCFGRPDLGDDVMMDAKHLTQNLRGKWYGRYGCAPCPVCQHEGHKSQHALTLADGTGGKLLLNCKKASCDYRDIATAAGIMPGTYTQPDPVVFAQRAAEQRKANAKRSQQAQRVWMGAQHVTGTVAESYLRGRGITCPLPDTLRFDPQCWHATGKRYPALVALVDGGAGFAVHRTYLRDDGSGKAEVTPPKAMLGAVQGGAVRLSDGTGPLVLAEGIETALSLCSGLLRAPATVWAALSTSGMRGVSLPDVPGRLTVAPDGDAAGRAAAQALATRAHAIGWQVSLLPAPDGRDWNDILTRKDAA